MFSDVPESRGRGVGRAEAVPPVPRRRHHEAPQEVPPPQVQLDPDLHG